jgi:hypothetical protein
MYKRTLAIFAMFAGLAMHVAAQQAPGPSTRQTGAGPFDVPQDNRPPLFFHEDFTAPPNSHGKIFTQQHVANPNLEVRKYCGAQHVQIAHHEDLPKNDPTFLWTGYTPGSWVVTFRHREVFADLSGLGKIRWRTQQTGFHSLRPVVKLANGTWLIGEHADGWTPDWHESEFWPAWFRWRAFNIENCLEAPTGTPFENGRWEPNPDFTRIDEIGFTDLMAGSGNGQGGWSRIDWIAVYAKPVKR